MDEYTIGGSGSLFVGEDKVLRFELVDAAATPAPVDMTGWTTVFDVRKKDNSAEPPILSITPVISGVFNASRVLNTQRAIVTLTDDHLNLFKGVPPSNPYRWSWKRMDTASETVLRWGDFSPQKATAP